MIDGTLKKNLEQKEKRMVKIHPYNPLKVELILFHLKMKDYFKS